MKKLHRIVSGFFVFCFCLSVIVNTAAAAEKARVEPNEKTTQLYYIVYDKDGHVVEEGLTPKGNGERYLWEGIRLTNGQYVRFLNGSNKAFSSSAGTRYDFIVQLNKKATMQNCLIQSNLAATEVVEVADQWTSISPSYSRTARFQNTGYYYFQIESNSSDTVIIMSAELLFS